MGSAEARLKENLGGAEHVGGSAVGGSAVGGGAVGLEEHVAGAVAALCQGSRSMWPVTQRGSTSI